jgi:hypothetical protein
MGPGGNYLILDVIEYFQGLKVIGDSLVVREGI